MPATDVTENEATVLLFDGNIKVTVNRRWSEDRDNLQAGDLEYWANRLGYYTCEKENRKGEFCWRNPGNICLIQELLQQNLLYNKPKSCSRT